MKNFLINLFTPLDTLIFNLMVKVGFIKPILGGLIGGYGARKAAKAQAQALQRIANDVRSPKDILLDTYGEEGMFSQDVMDRLIGTEERVMPQFIGLQKMQAREALLGEGGLSDIQADLRDKSLARIEQQGDYIRETLEDPRLRAMAERRMDIANKMLDETDSPLSFQEQRNISRDVTGSQFLSGTDLSNRAVAEAALGREDFRQKKLDRALGVLTGAEQSIANMAVDPYSFETAAASTPGGSLASAFIGGTPGGVSTDPGSAINLGLAEDDYMANLMMQKAGIKAKGKAAFYQGVGDTFNQAFDFFT